MNAQAIIRVDTQLRDIFLHHILLFLDVTEWYHLLKYESNKWYKENWYTHSKCDKKITNISTSFFVNGKLHREDKPAVVSDYGYKMWYINGKIHRENKPAVEYGDGTKEWWIEDKRHRDDGPAIERANGTKEWYQNGKRHRIDGAAIECPNGWTEHGTWWIDGEPLNEEEIRWKIRRLIKRDIIKYFQNKH